jgi:hypothetical protein
METLGVPATVVITEPFQSMVASLARLLGLPGYHSVIVPHPISTKDQDYLRAIARTVSDVVRRQLTE